MKFNAVIKQITKANYKLYYREIIFSLVFFIFSLTTTSIFALLTTFSTLINFSTSLAGFLTVLSGVVLLYPSIVGLFGGIAEAYNDTYTIPSFSFFKIFFAYYRMAFMYPVRGQLKILMTTVIEIAIYLILGNALMTLFTSTILNFSPGVNDFLKDFATLKASGASGATLFSFYLNNGSQYDVVINIVNVIVLSLFIFYFIFRVSYRFYYLAITSKTPKLYLMSKQKGKLYLRQTGFSMWKIFTSSYFKNNWPFYVSFLFIYGLSSVLFLAFSSSSFVFIVLVSVIIGFVGSLWTIPSVVFNALGVVDTNFKVISAPLKDVKNDGPLAELFGENFDQENLDDQKEKVQNMFDDLLKDAENELKSLKDDKENKQDNDDQAKENDAEKSSDETKEEEKKDDSNE